ATGPRDQRRARNSFSAGIKFLGSRQCHSAVVGRDRSEPDWQLARRTARRFVPTVLLYARRRALRPRARGKGLRANATPQEFASPDHFGVVDLVRHRTDSRWRAAAI